MEGGGHNKIRDFYEALYISFAPKYSLSRTRESKPMYTKGGDRFMDKFRKVHKKGRTNMYRI